MFISKFTDIENGIGNNIFPVLARIFHEVPVTLIRNLMIPFRWKIFSKTRWMSLIFRNEIDGIYRQPRDFEQQG